MTIQDDVLLGLLPPDVEVFEEGENGELCINPGKAGVKWAWIPARYNNTFPVTLPANGQIDLNLRVTPESGNKGNVEVGALMLTLATPANRCAIQPFIPQFNKHLSNVPIASSLMCGTSMLQSVLAQAIMAFPGLDWTFSVLDLSGAGNTVSLVAHGRRFAPGSVPQFDPEKALQFSKKCIPYWIGPSTGTQTTAGGVVTTVAGGAQVTLPPLGTVVLEYPVSGDAAFDCRWILDDSTNGLGTEPALTATIQEGDTAPPLNDTPMAWRDFLASPTTLAVATLPSGGFLRAASFPSPAGGKTHLFERNTKIRITFVSGEAVATITLRTALAGVNIYAPEAA